MQTLWNAQNCFPECSSTRFRGQAKLSANAGKETYTDTSLTIQIMDAKILTDFETFDQARAFRLQVSH